MFLRRSDEQGMGWRYGKPNDRVTISVLASDEKVKEQAGHLYRKVAEIVTAMCRGPPLSRTTRFWQWMTL
jgi:hypothetical protein